ncbi:MAG: Ig-like domain-containing protein [Bacteroidota bacterium]
MKDKILFILLSIFLICPKQIRAQHELDWVIEDEKIIRLILTGDELQQPQLYLKDQNQALLCRISQRNNEWSFRPAIPFQYTNTYEVRTKDSLIIPLKLPYMDRPQPMVKHFTPPLDTLPANLLKFHIIFDQPMSEQDPYPHIHLVDQEGDSLNRAFLIQHPPLWNRLHDELTIWLDPGRIKRELNLNQAFGNPLQEGISYHVHIGKGLRSAQGKELQEAYIKTFIAAAADRQRPEVTVSPPKSFQDPAILQFSESMDPNTVSGRIDLWKDGNKAKLNLTVNQQYDEWKIYPNESWAKGKYELRLWKGVEDLAGNNLFRLFDQEKREEQELAEEWVIMQFEIE